jgi:hypothetical protein
VQLSSTPGFYFNPDLDEPIPEPFIDPLSLISNRLWGQGQSSRCGVML